VSKIISLHLKISLALLLGVHFNNYSQDFKQQITVRSKDLSSRLIKAVSLQRADQLMIDALMDNDWEIQQVSMPIGNGFKRQAIKWTKCTMSGFVNYDLTFVTYSLEKVASNVVVDVEFKNATCKNQKEAGLKQDFYKDFWNSLGKVKFFDELDMDALKLR
jgi:hypothetical protein